MLWLFKPIVLEIFAFSLKSLRPTRTTELIYTRAVAYKSYFHLGKSPLSIVTSGQETSAHINVSAGLRDAPTAAVEGRVWVRVSHHFDDLDVVDRRRRGEGVSLRQGRLRGEEVLEAGGHVD